jgi:hypothetical protein
MRRLLMGPTSPVRKMPTILYVMANARRRIMAWLPVNIVMILGHQDLTLGEGSDPCNGVISSIGYAKHWMASA